MPSWSPCTINLHYEIVCRSTSYETAVGDHRKEGDTMKKNAIKGFALFILAFAILNTLTITRDRSTNTFLIQPGQKTAFALQLADCICCHGSTVDRHHLLASSEAFPCMRCHEVIFDPATQTYVPQLIRDCTVCHTIDVALLDRHHVLANQTSCFTCHQLVL